MGVFGSATSNLSNFSVWFSSQHFVVMLISRIFSDCLISRSIKMLEIVVPTPGFASLWLAVSCNWMTCQQSYAASLDHNGLLIVHRNANSL